MDGPLVKAEIANLRRTATQNHWLARALLGLAICLSLIPLWIDIGDSPRNNLLSVFLVVTVYVIELNIGLKTLTLASHAIAREAQAENWDNLIMTGLDARKIVLIKWWAVLRCGWRDYLVAGFLKLGIAYGLSIYFYNLDEGTCYHYLAGGLCYYGPYNNGLISAYRYFAGDLLVLFLVITGLFCLFLLADAGLTAALGICFGSLNRQLRIVGFGCALIFRGFLIFAAIVVWILLGNHSRDLYDRTTSSTFNPQVYYRWNMSPIERQEILGSVQFVLSPFADDGTLLITDLLRPVSSGHHIAQRLVTAVMALGAFGGLIWLSLRLAESFAVRQRVLRRRERALSTQEAAV